MVANQPRHGDATGSTTVLSSSGDTADAKVSQTSPCILQKSSFLLLLYSSHHIRDGTMEPEANGDGGDGVHPGRDDRASDLRDLNTVEGHWRALWCILGSVGRSNLSHRYCRIADDGSNSAEDMARTREEAVRIPDGDDTGVNHYNVHHDVDCYLSVDAYPDPSEAVGSLDQRKAAHWPHTCHSDGKKWVEAVQLQNSRPVRSKDCWHPPLGRSYSRLEVDMVQLLPCAEVLTARWQPLHLNRTAMKW